MIYAVTIALALPFTQGALYVTTSRARVSAFLEAVPMQPNQLLVDLGCGDGRVLKSAARRYGTKAVGYELNLLAYVTARLRCFREKDVAIRWQSFWTAELTEAHVVFCYLYPDVMQRLATRLKSELNPGTVVVSCNFKLPGWTALQVLRPGGPLHNDPIYIYRKR